MGSFKIEAKGSTEHDLKKVDKKYIPKIVQAIASLAENPFPFQSKKLKDSESSYRLRVGDYRVIYQVDRVNKSIFTMFAIERTFINDKGITPHKLMIL